MKKIQNVIYFTEGQNEEKLIKVLKTEMKCLIPGKTECLNVLTHKITNGRMMALMPHTTVVMVFDTDVDCPLEILNANIKALNEYPSVDNVITVPQVKTIEDELVYSTDIKAVTKLLPSSSNKAFKSDFNRMADRNLAAKLKSHGFDISKLWSRNPGGEFSSYYNDTGIIKILL
ncbi:MAG: hypothetical protein ACI4CX_02205 [Candidatus Weimeria sp.]|jgi:hypothetical protein